MNLYEHRILSHFKADQIEFRTVWENGDQLWIVRVGGERYEVTVEGRDGSAVVEVDGRKRGCPDLATVSALLEGLRLHPSGPGRERVMRGAGLWQ